MVENYGLNENKLKKDQATKPEVIECIKRLKDPNISKDEENECFTKVWQAYKAYVRKVLNETFSGYFRNYTDDMMQEAALQMFLCLPKFDPDMNYALTTFLKPNIVHAGQKYINEQLLDTSVHYGTYIGKIKKLMNQCEADGTTCNEYVISERLGIPFHTVIKCLEQMNAQNVIHYESNEFTEESISDSDSNERNPESQFIRKSDNEIIRKLVYNLSPDLRKVAIDYFGFDGDPKTITAIAQEMDIDKNKVTTMLNTITRQLKAACQAEGLGAPHSSNSSDNDLVEITMLPKVTQEDEDEARALMELSI